MNTMNTREHAIVFRADDGRQWLRGMVEPTDTDLANLAAELGADRWVEIGTIEGEDALVSDADYDRHGNRIAKFTRKLGDTRSLEEVHDDEHTPPNDDTLNCRFCERAAERQWEVWGSIDR